MDASRTATSTTPRLFRMLVTWADERKHPISRWIARCALVCITAAATSPAAAVQIEFDNANDILLFTRKDAFQWRPIQWRSTGGIGNSGSLLVDRPHATTYSTESFEMTTVGDTITVSTFFRTSNFSPPGPSNFFTFGEVYLTKEPGGFPFDADAAFVDFETDSTTNSVRGGPLQAGGGSYPGFDRDFPLGTIMPNRWYEFNVVYENLGGLQIGWDIEINDFGPTGLDSPTTVFSTSVQTPDTRGFTTDPTLYAGFVASQSGTAAIDRFAVNPPTGPAPRNVLIEPTFDVQLKPGPIYSIEEGATQLVIDGGSGTTFPVLEVLAEFDLSQIPQNADIVSARAIFQSKGGSTGGLTVQAKGYAGDGLASLSDVIATPTLIGSSAGPFSVGQMVNIVLDDEFVESMLGDASHLGLRLSSMTVGPYVNIESLESSTGEPLTLSLQYTVPGLTGDFNGDNTVDAADYVVWRKTDGQTGSALAGDGNGDGKVDSDDYEIWRANFGRMVSGSGLSASALGSAEGSAAPEPASILPALLLAAIRILGRGTRSICR